jgi:hypothetical protein
MKVYEVTNKEMYDNLIKEGLKPTDEVFKEVKQKRTTKSKLDKLYDIIKKHENLYMFDDTFETFILMEQKIKPLALIETGFARCKKILETPLKFCIQTGCDKCTYADADILGQIRQFKIDIENFGYYCEITKDYNLVISKIKELVDIVVIILQEPINLHAAIIGFALGYTEKEELAYMNRTGEIEIDWEIARIVQQIISESVKKGILVKSGDEYEEYEKTKKQLISGHLAEHDERVLKDFLTEFYANKGFKSAHEYYGDLIKQYRQ